MKVLYLIDKLTRAGTQTHLVQVMKGLDKKQFEPAVICLEAGGPLVDDIKALGIEINVLDIPNWNSIAGIKGVFQLYRHIKAFSPDVVHCYLFTANVFGGLAARMAGIKKTITSRRDLGTMLTPKQIIISRVANLFATEIVSNSFAVKDAADRIEKIKCPHSVIHNGIDPNGFYRSGHHDEFKDQFGLPRDKIIMGTLGNIRIEKDPACLVNAFIEVAQTREDIVLAYAGGIKDETLFKSIKQRIPEHIAPRCYFLGAVSEPKKFLACLDLFVFTSQSEGFSNAILEAMATALPVIASEVGGNVEQVENDINGYLFPLGDHATCAQQILKIFTQDKLLRFGDESRRLINDKFNLPIMIRKMSELYSLH